MLNMATPVTSFQRLSIWLGIGLVTAACVATHGQLASDQLVTRTFKLIPVTNQPLQAIKTEQGIVTFSPPLELQSRKEQLEIIFRDAGLDLLADPFSTPAGENKKAYFYNDRTRALMVRATLADMNKIEDAVRALSSPPPQVSIDARLAEIESDQLAAQFKALSVDGKTRILTETQFREAIARLQASQGVDLLTMPSIQTISGRQARMSMERATPPMYQTPPRLPKDTRPDADPTPRNKERLPFPPTFVPESLSAMRR
jgi:hypothetical protein